MGKVDCESKVSKLFKKGSVLETGKLTAVENGTLQGARKADKSTLPKGNLERTDRTHNSSTQFSSWKPLPASTRSWHSRKWCLAGEHSFEFSHSS